MMHGREKSDSAIVAGKPTNKAVLTAAEPVERRAGAKGNASQQSTRRTQSRVSVSHALERIRQNRNEKNALPSHTQGGSRMPELGPYGSVRGALSNERPYRDLRNVGANYPFERSHGFPGIKEVWPPRLFAFELRRRGYAARACVTDARSAGWTGCPRASMQRPRQASWVRHGYRGVRAVCLPRVDEGRSVQAPSGVIPPPNPKIPRGMSEPRLGAPPAKFMPGRGSRATGQCPVLFPVSEFAS